MLPPPPATPSKRYWGEEKNIDSIYSIYLKKISYTYNNDISLSANYTKQQPTNGYSTPKGRGHTIDESSASSNDLARLSSQQQLYDGSPNSSFNKKQLNGCYDRVDGSVHPQEKPKESPRGRKLFFQKYRRRSCSMDKYSFDKQNNSLKGLNQNIKSDQKTPSKTMRLLAGSASKKQQQLQHSEDFSHSHDKLDTLSTDKNSSIDSASDSQSGSRMRMMMNNSDLQKSMHELYGQSQSQSLQWETRQIRVLQAATLDHVLKFILLITSQKANSNLNSAASSSSASISASDQDSTDPTGGDCQLEEERNNVAHIIHVFFCTYRTYTNPYELMMKLMDYSDICRVEQYRFVMHYWIDNYPEDFDYLIPDSNPQITTNRNGNHNQDSGTSAHSNSFSHSIASCDSSLTTRTAATSDSETSGNLAASGSQVSGGSDSLDRRLSNLSIKTNEDKLAGGGVPLISELLRLCRDEYIRGRAMRLRDSKMTDAPTRNGSLDSNSAKKSSRNLYHHNGSKSSAVLDLDSRYVAQQLTAIDLENFLSLKPYSLLEGTKSDKRIQSMIKNFNLLSRHVVITILKSHQPATVAAHWIAIAMNLRKIKNFNSLKAIIAGLTNESIYRLKQVIWNKLDKMSTANFKTMASIVDDVNNQIVLRQTQLVVEGTAKMSIEDDSFGTIPYLGTFLTDLNMIDARYPNYVPSPKDSTSKLKLINLEKCAKQFEILTQVQLLQKNVLASLHAIQRRNHFDEQSTLNKLKMEYNQSHQMLLAKPAIPKVARLFENWFYDSNVVSMTDKQW